MFQRLTAILAAGSLFPLILSAQLHPLSENLWDNEDFRQRFLGSYGFDTNVTPSISSAEQSLFQDLLPLMREDPEEAAARLAEALTADSSAALDYTLGNLYAQSRRPEEAIAAYKNAINKFPNFQRAHKNLGLVLVNEGESRASLPFLRKAIELGGNDGAVWGPLGLAYLDLGRFEQALRSYENALLFAPDNPQWQRGKLQVLLNLGRYREAAETLDGMLLTDPENANLWTWQANAFLSLGERDKAGANLEILKRLGSANSEAIALLGDIYLDKRVYDLALKNYREAAVNGGLTHDRALRIAEALTARSLWAEAGEYLEVLSGREDRLSNADRKRFHTLLAQVAIEKGDTVRAEEILEAIVAEDPMNGRALMTLGRLQRNKEEYEEAAFSFEQAAKADETAVAALIEHGRMEVSRRNYERGIELLERSLLLDRNENVEAYLERVKQVAASVARQNRT